MTTRDTRFDHGLLLMVAVLELTPARFRLVFAWRLLCAAAGVLLRPRYAQASDLEVQVKLSSEVR
jgi:hypothetical protein